MEGPDATVRLEFATTHLPPITCHQSALPPTDPDCGTQREAIMHTSRCWRTLLVVAATFLAAQAPAQPRFNFDATPGQLGKDVVPAEYRLALDLDPAKDTLPASSTSR